MVERSPSVMGDSDRYAQVYFIFLFFYESRKRELKTRLIYEDR